MTVKKVSGKKDSYAVYHCHGKDKGKIAGKVYTGKGAKEKAQKQHTAIILSKKRRGKMPKSSKPNPVRKDRKSKKGLKPMSVFEQHSLRIARQTLRYPDAIAGVMGGMTKSQAKSFIDKMKREGKI